MKKNSTVYLCILLCTGLFFSSLIGCGGTLVFKTNKSVRGMYSPRNKSVAICQTHNARKIECHAKHVFCPQCTVVCKECPKDCIHCEETCQICYDEHSPAEEVGLTCNHIFGKVCIEKWEQICIEDGKSATCPICRADIAYKTEQTCDLCDDPILIREKSVSWSCTYECWISETETHTCHKRCITSYALKAAHWKNREDVRVFHCPILHKKACSKTYLYKVLLSAVACVSEYKSIPYLRPYQIAKLKNPCGICNKEIKKCHFKISYTCTWQKDFFWGKISK